MEPRQILRSGITASALAHLLCLLLVIFFAEVHPFGSVTAEPIAVDLVRPDEVVAQKPKDPELPPKETQKPSDQIDLSSKVDPAAKPDSSNKLASKASEASSSPPPSPAPAAAKPQPPAAPAQKQAALTPPGSSASSSAAPSSAIPAPAPQSAAAQPAPAPASNSAPGFGQQPQAAPAQAPFPAPVLPAYTPAQPDVSIKYHVLLGLPQNNPGDGFDGPATEKADVGTDSIAEFRRHLKTCSTLPKEVSPSDHVAIKLRVLMTPEGRLAAEPVLIEASASMKGPLLMQSAIKALEDCQPYAMLPADRYKEWKVLDLNFTPQDFVNAS